MKILRLLIPVIALSTLFWACQPSSKEQHSVYELNDTVLQALGNQTKEIFESQAEAFKNKVQEDSTNVDAILAYTEMEVILYVFGYIPRDISVSKAKSAFKMAWAIDSANSHTLTFHGILSMLDWKWKAAEQSFLKAIALDSANLRARHWYSLYLSAMGDFDGAMAQSDTIATMDSEGNYLIGRGSLLYFARRNQEMKELMIVAIAKDTTVAWGYDWLGMAYVEMKDFENSIETYFKAFELSDGTVEVGAGLGHALGLAGHYEPAKKMADYYTEAAKSRYLPPVQRAFVHIGIGENEQALDLLEQAYQEHSWFLIFMQIEPWYDPIRADKRFSDIVDKMNFPE